MEQRSDELMHYGVPGMRWGVKRNARVLTMHRRNINVKDVKNAYRKGQISKKERNVGIKTAKKDAKADLKQMRSEIRNVKTRKGLKEMKTDIKNQTLSEVPHSSLKKGLTTVNKMFSAATISGTAAVGAGLTVVGGAAASTVLPIAAAGVMVELGRKTIIQKGILDKLA